MKSKVNIKTHPLHPMLVPFPIAFFTGTLISHLVGWLMNMPDLLRTAYFLNIGGIGFALLAAVPGFLDFLYTVPPKSTGKKRAAKHGIINVTMVVCFAVALFFRRDSNHIIVALLEVIGVSLMVIAGWMGGTLVYRNQIGIDIRYAHAGKWNEASYDVSEGEIEVATKDELKINSMKLLHVRNKRIVLARTEDRYVAFDDRCTHRGGSLASGSTMCNTVQCPWHGSQFDLITGAVKAGPAQEAIKIYTIKESQGKILLVV